MPQRRIQSPKWDTICRFSRCCFLTPFLTCHPTFPLNPIQYESLKVLVTQSCPTLCDPMNCSSPGSSVHGNLQARILEWVAIPFSRGSSPPRDQSRVSCITGRFFSVWATRELAGIFFSNIFDLWLNLWIWKGYGQTLLETYSIRCCTYTTSCNPFNNPASYS